MRNLRHLFSRRHKLEEAGHRHIYIGDIQEIENDELGENTQSESKFPKIPEESEGLNLDVGSPGVASLQLGGGINSVASSMIDQVENVSKVTEQEEISHTLSQPPPLKMTTRRNSAAAGVKKSPPKPAVFRNNKIVSSRYTPWNFLIKNLFEQFRRIVNFYFLVMAIVQAMIDSPVSPLTSAAPLFFVIVVTAVKQGYEDYIRHKADDIVNNRPVHIVKDGYLVRIKAKEIRVGNILKLEGEEQVPADILVVGSSDEFLRCQILTANLDGETNLKNRYCPSGLPSLKGESDFIKLNAVVECEQPNSDLYVFNGSLLIPTDRLTRSSNASMTPLISESGIQENLSPNQLSQSGRSRAAGISTARRASNAENDGDGTGRGRSASMGSGYNPTSKFIQIPCTMDNMVLRGTKVKNTEFIYGLVVYTGQDTRLAQNSKTTHTKFSTVEKSVNLFLILFIGVLMVLVSICTTIHFVMIARRDQNKDAMWYFSMNDKLTALNLFNTFASFLILFNYIIPISLYVTMEMQKFFGSKFFVWDMDMTDPLTGQQALCNTSDLNEELGQIEYLFSDKTGTLTENVMDFRYCSVNGVRYDFKETEERLYRRDDENRINEPINVENVADVKQFLLTLALCHTVQVMEKRRKSFESSMAPEMISKLSSRMKGADSVFSLTETKQFSADKKWEYQASSPDEKALLEACYRLGIMYLGEKEDVLTLDVCGEIETYKRHYVLEFDADRKCMSVIIENTKGEIWLLIKGAESSLIPKCDTGPGAETMKHIVAFAMTGMRTLAVARKQLTKHQLHAFGNELKKTRRLLKHREEKMRELYRSIESHLEVLGATAVEDQLQEGVPETLQALSAAGIHVWMLTGDKLETAINIAISCGLLTPASKQILVSNMSVGSEVVARLHEIRSEMTEGDNTTVVIDGESLATAFVFCPDDLQYVTMTAFRVVCCRMAPLQKAQVVNMVKNSKRHPITAAVGDGANDVAMIQEAHIGLGILGKEGRQAARCSDFALAKFSFLRKAILVHGHWYYVRLSTLAVYFFYKNVVFILPQVYFSGFSAFSTLSLFDGYFLTMFNIFFAAAPIVCYGLQEQPYSAKTLMDHPQYYKTLTRNSILKWSQFLVWNLFALYHSAVCFFLPYLVWSAFEPMTDWSGFGTIVFCAVVAVTNMKLVIETKFFTGFTVFGLCYSFGTFAGLTSIYAGVDMRGVGLDIPAFSDSFFEVQSVLPFWLLMLLVNVMCLAPDLAIKGITSSWGSIVKISKRGTKPPMSPEAQLNNLASSKSLPTSRRASLIAGAAADGETDLKKGQRIVKAKSILVQVRKSTDPVKA